MDCSQLDRLYLRNCSLVRASVTTLYATLIAAKYRSTLRYASCPRLALLNCWYEHTFCYEHALCPGRLSGPWASGRTAERHLSPPSVAQVRLNHILFLYIYSSACRLQAFPCLITSLYEIICPHTSFETISYVPQIPPSKLIFSERCLCICSNCELTAKSVNTISRLIQVTDNIKLRCI